MLIVNKKGQVKNLDNRIASILLNRGEIERYEPMPEPEPVKKTYTKKVAKNG